MRYVETIHCSCGGEPEEATPSEEEEKFGCGHPGCCVKAWVCLKCHTTWVFVLEAPGV